MSVHAAMLEAGWLMSQIRNIVPDADEDLLATAVEGETNLTEQVTILLRSAENDRALAAALKIRIDELETRLDHIELRIEKKRDLAAQAMGEFHIKRIQAPEFTASLVPSPQKVLIPDEKILPKQFWRQKPPPPPEPDKTAIKEAIKNGASVPGAFLSNPSYHVMLRRD